MGTSVWPFWQVLFDLAFSSTSLEEWLTYDDLVLSSKILSKRLASFEVMGGQEFWGFILEYLQDAVSNTPTLVLWDSDHYI